MPLRLGTRASALARWQADWVAARLQEHGHEVEMVLITTQGDATQGDASSVSSLGGVGVFTKELQRALLDGRIDLAVHSLKDLPTDVVDGLLLAAVPERESVFDVLISREGLSFEKLPQGAKMGTGSLRRRAQLLHLRSDLQMADIRGNVDSRIRKLRDGEFDAIVLAEAGVKRLGLVKHVTQIFAADTVLPAVGQGALGIESRTDDTATRAALVSLDHLPSHHAVLAERALLAGVRGGCLAPIGAWARLQKDEQLRLSTVVLSSDGGQRILAEAIRPPAEAIELGRQVADQLLAQGAASLIAAARG